jgi:hypothetical protein
VTRETLRRRVGTTHASLQRVSSAGSPTRGIRES